MTSRRRPRSDPAQVEADAEEYARALEREAERDLARDPERKRYARAADPDEHRRTARRQLWRAKP